MEHLLLALPLTAPLSHLPAPQACLERLASAEAIEDWYSPALGRRGVASKTVRFKTFPRYLIVELQRYNQANRKLEALVELPEQLDLTALRSPGPQADEVRGESV